VYSWVVTHFTVDRGWVDDVPYTTVAVELDEGPRVLGALRRDRDGVALSIGMDVTVSGEATGDDFVFLWVDPSP
jgi:uncharacterized OB-fold protein